jgi:ABC-type protease/lipase transport system fused ATPase/permease subunit
MKFLWDELRPLLIAMAAFSFFINVLSLVPSLFMLQVFDRVLPSNSEETLLVLVAGTGVALLILLLLDYIRNRVQNVLGTLIDELLSPPVVHAIVTKMVRTPHNAGMVGIRDVAALRNVFAANGVIALFDTP